MSKPLPGKDALREAAERKLTNTPVATVRSAEELLHELQVHQIELEMQNESLRQAQVALEESRNRYVDLYEFAPLAYFTLTHTGLVTQVNLTGAALLGTERQKMLQGRFADFVAPANRDRWHCHFMGPMQQQGRQRIEISLQREDGSLLHVALDSLCAVSADGTAEVRMSLSDMTRQRKTEDSLQAWGYFAEHANWGMATVDRESRRIVLCNAAYAQMHGYNSADELRGLLAETLYEPEARSALMEKIKALDREGHISYESRRLRKDGSTFQAIMNLSLAVSDGRTSVIVNVRDISAQKQAEDEFQRFFDLIPEMACIATHDARLVKVNPAWQRTLGYSEQDLLGASFLDFIHPDDLDGTLKAIQDKLSGEDARGFVNRYRCKEGGYKWLEWTSSPAANKKLLYATARDITERHLVEDALRESRNFAVSIFDSLGKNIAVLDETGVITAVNSAWRRFATENGNPDLSAAVGLNYLAVCTLPSSDTDSANAAAAKAGIQAVLSGAVESYTLEYPCHSPKEQRWFEMRVRRLLGPRPCVVVAHENITARICSDEGIRFRDAALEASATAILTTDRHGVIAWANQAFSLLSGYAQTEVIGRTPGALINSGKNKPTVFQELWRTILAGNVWQGEMINRRKDGSLYHEQQTITPVRDGRGQIIQFIAVKQDISDRKHLEAAMRDSEERYRMIFEMSEDAIFVSHPEEARILMANPAACKMFGYSEMELRSLGRAGITDATDPAWAVLLAERTAHGYASAQVRCIRRNGDIFPAEVNSIVFHDSSEQLRGVIHIRDISAQIHAEKALRESEMRWQFAVESHGDAMWDWDADKDRLFLTAAAKELFNLPDTDTSRPFADLLAQVFADDRALVREQIDDIMLGRTTEWLSECRFIGHGEKPRWIATRGRVMTRSADGRPHRIVSISSDVTLKRARQAEARHQSALVAQQGRLVLLGELASALAHEINQPLTAIMGFSAACARKLAEFPNVLELVHDIETQAMRAGDIAWRMRGFARRQSQGRCALSLNEVVSGVVKWLSVDSAFSHAAIDISGIDSNLPMVSADRVELEQVLVNLVRNGIEASLPGIGEISIVIAARLGKQSSEIEVSVTDSGSGLPTTPDFEVFKPFMSTKVEGLGLGLTICYSIIEGHGGHLWATPNPAGGTIFRFTLPLAESTVSVETTGVPVAQLSPEVPRR